jgi:hypothetical protein
MKKIEVAKKDVEGILNQLTELKKLKSDVNGRASTTVAKITQVKEENEREVRRHYSHLRETLYSLENKIIENINQTA